LTRLRTTALPTLLATTNPTCAPAASASRARWTTRDDVPLRAPRRTACSNSAGRRMRDAAGSTGGVDWEGSGRELGAALAPTRGEDRPAGARAHAQPEAVGLRATPVVRLEGPLAHEGSPTTSRVCTARHERCEVCGRLDVRPGAARLACGHDSRGRRSGLATLLVRPRVGQTPAVRALSLDRDWRRDATPGEDPAQPRGRVRGGVVVDAVTEGHGEVARITQGVDNCVDHRGPCETSGRMSDDLQRG
jgi:hypothetical protein